MHPMNEVRNARERYEEERRKAWVQVWAYTASANDCKSPAAATNFADEALKAFDSRFAKDFM